MKYTLAILSTIFALSGANAQVSEFKPGIAAEGVNYLLPKTALKVTVSARKITHVPGEYAKYAQRYMHVQNVEAEAYTRFEMTSIEVSSFGVPDKSKCYTIKLKDKTLAPLVQLLPNGILASVNDEVTEPVLGIPQHLSTNNRLDARKYLTSEILAAASTSKMAELVAQEILDIRESKNSLCRGQVDAMPKDGASFKVVLKELEIQERALMQLFVGYTDTITCSETYTLVPEQEVSQQVLFRFSKKLGFVDADDLAGEPFYIDIKDLHSVDIPAPEVLAKRKITGIVYNLPGNASVSIYNTQSSIFDKDYPFAQFGTTDILGDKLFTTKEFNTQVIFNTATGGIMHIKQ